MFVVVETDVVTKVTVFAVLCTSDVELVAAGLLEELSLNDIIGTMVAGSEKGVMATVEDLWPWRSSGVRGEWSVILCEEKRL